MLKFVATCACTCTTWRSVVDARRTELLSHLGCIADPAAFDRCLTQLRSRPRHGPSTQKPSDLTVYKAALRDAITLILGDDNDAQPAEWSAHALASRVATDFFTLFPLQTCTQIENEVHIVADEMTAAGALQCNIHRGSGTRSKYYSAAALQDMLMPLQDALTAAAWLGATPLELLPLYAPYPAGHTLWLRKSLYHSGGIPKSADSIFIEEYTWHVQLSKDGEPAFLCEWWGSVKWLERTPLLIGAFGSDLRQHVQIPLWTTPPCDFEQWEDSDWKRLRLRIGIARKNRAKLIFHDVLSEDLFFGYCRGGEKLGRDLVHMSNTPIGQISEGHITFCPVLGEIPVEGTADVPSGVPSGVLGLAFDWEQDGSDERPMSMREVVQALEHVLARAAGGSDLSDEDLTANLRAHLRDLSDEDRILSLFRHLDSEEGATVDQAAIALASNGANIALQQVRSVIESYVAEGRMYSTIDDDHFRVT